MEDNYEDPESYFYLSIVFYGIGDSGFAKRNDSATRRNCNDLCKEKWQDGFEAAATRSCWTSNEKAVVLKVAIITEATKERTMISWRSCRILTMDIDIWNRSNRHRCKIADRRSPERSEEIHGVHVAAVNSY